MRIITLFLFSNPIYITIKKSTKSIIDKQSNKCKGYGFVDFVNHEDALKAIAELEKEHKGSILIKIICNLISIVFLCTDVQLAKQRIQDPTNIYFANLPLDIDEKSIAELLQTKFDAIVISTRIMREKNGNSKGVGFARINDGSICNTIIQELNGKIFPSKII